MKFYIASSLENASLVRQLAARFIALGHEQSYDWTTHGSVQMEGVARIREVAAAEIQGVARADLVVVRFPGGRGTHVELGAAIGMVEAGARKVIVLVGTPPLESGRTCAFYHHPAVVTVDDEDEVLSWLERSDVYRDTADFPRAFDLAASWGRR